MSEELKVNPMEESDHGTGQESGNDSYEDGQDHDIKKDNNEILLFLEEQTFLLKDIQEKIKNRIEYDEIKEKAIDKLNDELKFYRDGFLFEYQKPLFIDLMLLYDYIEWVIGSIDIDKGFSTEKLISKIENVKQELLEILYRRDIVPFDEHPEFLDYRLHHTLKTIFTNDESENNKIDKIIKTGFRIKNRILRPEVVVIKKFKSTEVTNDTEIKNRGH